MIQYHSIHASCIYKTKVILREISGMVKLSKNRSICKTLTLISWDGGYKMRFLQGGWFRKVHFWGPPPLFKDHGYWQCTDSDGKVIGVYSPTHHIPKVFKTNIIFTKMIFHQIASQDLYHVCWQNNVILCMSIHGLQHDKGFRSSGQIQVKRKATQTMFVHPCPFTLQSFKIKYKDTC